MVDPTINKVYYIARTLHDENRIDKELWYVILEMKDAHIKEIDFGEQTEYFKERANENEQ